MTPKEQVKIITLRRVKMEGVYVSLGCKHSDALNRSRAVINRLYGKGWKYKLLGDTSPKHIRTTHTEYNFYNFEEYFIYG